MGELRTELFHPSPQVLQAFEEIPMCSVLEQIKEKHNLEKVKKVSGLTAALASSQFKLTILCCWKGWCLQIVVLRFLLKQITIMN